MTRPAAMSWRSWCLVLPWLLLIVTGLIAAALRYGLIESRSVVAHCSTADPAVWCAVRQTLVQGFQHNVYGIVGLLFGAVALWRRSPWLAWLAAASGLWALQLYCFQAGALALLIGSLRLLRLQARARSRMPPVQQHRQRDHQVQSQP